MQDATKSNILSRIILRNVRLTKYNLDFVSTDNLRPAMNYVLFNARTGHVVATNGQVLAIYEIPEDDITLLTQAGDEIDARDFKMHYDGCCSDGHVLIPPAAFDHLRDGRKYTLDAVRKMGYDFDIDVISGAITVMEGSLESPMSKETFDAGDEHFPGYMSVVNRRQREIPSEYFGIDLDLITKIKKALPARSATEVVLRRQADRLLITPKDTTTYSRKESGIPRYRSLYIAMGLVMNGSKMEGFVPEGFTHHTKIKKIAPDFEPRDIS